MVTLRSVAHSWTCGSACSWTSSPTLTRSAEALSPIDGGPSGQQSRCTVAVSVHCGAPGVRPVSVNRNSASRWALLYRQRSGAEASAEPSWRRSGPSIVIETSCAVVPAGGVDVELERVAGVGHRQSAGRRRHLRSRRRRGRALTEEGQVAAHLGHRDPVAGAGGVELDLVGLERFGGGPTDVGHRARLRAPPEEHPAHARALSDADLVERRCGAHRGEQVLRVAGEADLGQQPLDVGTTVAEQRLHLGGAGDRAVEHGAATREPEETLGARARVLRRGNVAVEAHDHRHHSGDERRATP
jgi:hypothetical protein